MKQLESWCREYSERWNAKDKWDFYCLVKDAWLNGFKKAREEAVQIAMDSADNEPEGMPCSVSAAIATSIQAMGEDPIKVTMASNQIGQK